MKADTASCPGPDARPIGAAAIRAAAFVAILFSISPGMAYACACGCGVFDIGTSALFPSGTGGIGFLEYDYMNQNRNWSGTSRAPSDDNSDKQIRTQFYTAGFNYMWNHTWGVMVKVPYWNRDFTTDLGGGDVETFSARSIGDIRVEGMYTGFSPDMSTGVTFGLQLPTGDYTNPNFDRDTQIGSGSTDVLLGAYHLGVLDENGNWNWFVQGHYQHAIATRVAADPSGGVALDYRPGDEFDTTLGLTYSFGPVGPFSNVALVGQVKGSVRARDTGGAAFNTDTGYSRVLAAPGISAKLGAALLYADIETPAYQKVNGNQLTAGSAFKVLVGFSF
jgi:hypothetical protein